MLAEIDYSRLETIICEVLVELGYHTHDAGPSEEILPAPSPQEAPFPADITSPESRGAILVPHPADAEGLERMKSRTTARIGAGRAGARLNSQSFLTLRADHAAARDAVFLDVLPEVLEKSHLFQVQSRCQSKNEYLTRPDLGRQLNEAGAEMLRRRCVMNPDIQLFASDGLSSAAINANLPDIIPIMMDGLQDSGLKIGTPFFVKYGRVGIEDHVSEVLGAKVVCVLIGERPGLATAESMSAYIAYNARIGMPESRRTVVSNIHRTGIPAVEAGAYLTDLLLTIFRAKASGVDLKRGE